MTSESEGNELASHLYAAMPGWLRFLAVPWNWFRKRSDPVRVMKLQEVRKAELRRNLDFDRDNDEVPEIVAIRLSRSKRYPNKPPRLFNLGSSDWHKFEVKAVSDQTLDIFAKITTVRFEGKKAREVFEGDDAETVFVVGKIPLESIRHIRWSDDPAYGLPRLYLDFGFRGPFKEVAVTQQDRPGGYYFERTGVKFKPVKYRWWKVLQLNWRDRKEAKP